MGITLHLQPEELAEDFFNNFFSLDGGAVSSHQGQINEVLPLLHNLEVLIPYPREEHTD